MMTLSRAIASGDAIQLRPACRNTFVTLAVPSIHSSMHGDGETSTVVTGRPGKKGAPDGSEGGSRGSEGGGGNSSGDAATKEETESTPYSELEKSGNVRRARRHSLRAVNIYQIQPRPFHEPFHPLRLSPPNSMTNTFVC
jgi:hypothetical protein